MSPMERQVYPNKTTFKEFSTRFFDEPGISATNKKAIKDFLDKQLALSVGERRLRKYLSTFKRILIDIYPGFELAKAKEKDINELHRRIREAKLKGEEDEEEKDMSLNTRGDYVKIIRRFYKVTQGRNARMPEKCDFFKPLKNVRVTKGPDDLITREQFKKLLGSCLNIRDKCALWMLMEGGFRIGELVALDMKDVRLTEDAVDVTVPDKPGCKTGSRPVALILSYRYVREWNESHPCKGKPGAPFFVCLEGEGSKEDQRITGWTIRAMIHRAAARAGLGGANEDVSRYHPHAFRHTACTEKAILGFTEVQHANYFGFGIEMARVYVHLNSENTRKIYQEKLGLNKGQEKAVKVCGKCGKDNPFTAEECGRCGTTLDPKKRLELENKKDKMLDRLQALIDFEPAFGEHMEKTNKRYEETKLGKILLN